MKIGDEVLIHGYIDEIRKDIVIIRNEGGYFGTVKNEIFNQSAKTGHWIMIDKELQRYKCSECGEVIRLYKKSEIPKLEKDETLSDYPFSHCGCRMVEP